MDANTYERLSASERHVVDDIREHGWHAVWVPEESVGPGFNYSIGLIETLNHPEIIMFGLERDLMHGVMWIMVREIRAGRRFEEPALYGGLLDGYACAIRPVHASRHVEFLGYGMWYMRTIGRSDQLRAVQLFWPSKSGPFPWEEGCPKIVADLQPLLYQQAAPSSE